MIRFSFKIRNPWSHDLPHKDYFYKHKTLSKNKSFEVQIFKSSSYDLFSVNLNLDWRGEDHAGPEFYISFWKYNAIIKIYDHRHWDYETGNWEKYEEQK